MEFRDSSGDLYVITKHSHRLILKKDMLPGDEIDIITLRKGGNPFIIRFDPNAADSENMIQKRKAELLKGHPDVMVVMYYDKNGMPVYESKQCVVHQFDYVDSTANHTRNVHILKKFIRNLNIVNNMTIQEKKDVMYFFGRNPEGMTHSTILMELADPTKGLAVSRDKYDSINTKKGSEPRSYLEYFSDEYDNKNSTIGIQTLVRKAICIRTKDDMPIIERKKDGTYWSEKTFLGASFSDVIKMLGNDAKMFQYINRLVIENDLVVDDDIPEILRMKGYKENNDIIEESAMPDISATDKKEYDILVNYLRDIAKRTDITETMTIEELRSLKRESVSLYAKMMVAGMKKMLDENPHWDYNRMQEEFNEVNKYKTPARKKEYIEKRRNQLMEATKAQLENPGASSANGQGIPANGQGVPANGQGVPANGQGVQEGKDAPQFRTANVKLERAGSGR